MGRGGGGGLDMGGGAVGLSMGGGGGRGGSRGPRRRGNPNSPAAIRSRNHREGKKELEKRLKSEVAGLQVENEQLEREKNKLTESVRVLEAEVLYQPNLRGYQP